MRGKDLRYLFSLMISPRFSSHVFRCDLQDIIESHLLWVVCLSKVISFTESNQNLEQKRHQIESTSQPLGFDQSLTWLVISLVLVRLRNWHLRPLLMSLICWRSWRNYLPFLYQLHSLSINNHKLSFLPCVPLWEIQFGRFTHRNSSEHLRTCSVAFGRLREIFGGRRIPVMRRRKCHAFHSEKVGRYICWPQGIL